MSYHDKAIGLIGDDRLTAYTNRARSGTTQVFYKGTDSRDFARYHRDQKNEDGTHNNNAVMHDKPDTIKIEPPERHYYAELINGSWHWVNGCAECNGQPRDWMTYVECDTHNVCRTCKTPRSEITETPWGGKNGWQCKPCAEIERLDIKATAFAKVAEEEYDSWDFHHCDQPTCPHCATSYEVGDPVSDGKETCSVCGGEYSVEVEHSVSYTTAVIGERLTA